MLSSEEEVTEEQLAAVMKEVKAREQQLGKLLIHPRLKLRRQKRTLRSSRRWLGCSPGRRRSRRYRRHSRVASTGQGLASSILPGNSHSRRWEGKLFRSRGKEEDHW